MFIFLNDFTDQQMLFFVLYITGNVLHFCIVNEEQRRRGEKKQTTLTTLSKLFMRLYTGNRAAQKCAAFFFAHTQGYFENNVAEIFYKNLTINFLLNFQTFFEQKIPGNKTPDSVLPHRRSLPHLCTVNEREQRRRRQSRSLAPDTIPFHEIIRVIGAAQMCVALFFCPER
ncbi:MAG: hypothetical protein IPJ82_13645 [Lewinellaceae bacterium]|nr:hypothetical protein [Lewinellaceae bacterium]